MLNELKVNNKYKRIIQLELNEISRPVIELLILKNKLPNFAKINQKWTCYQTLSENKYENWEPWIQWVTAHTGKTLAEHKIFRLSDIHHLKHKQIFETLSEHGIKSAIVGSMNVIRRSTKGGFFFPIPGQKQVKFTLKTLNHCGN